MHINQVACFTEKKLEYRYISIGQFEDQATNRLLIAALEECEDLGTTEKNDEDSGTTQKGDVKKTPAKKLL